MLFTIIDEFNQLIFVKVVDGISIVPLFKSAEEASDYIEQRFFDRFKKSCRVERLDLEKFLRVKKEFKSQSIEIFLDIL